MLHSVWSLNQFIPQIIEYEKHVPSGTFQTGQKTMYASLTIILLTVGCKVSSYNSIKKEMCLFSYKVKNIEHYY